MTDTNPTAGVDAAASEAAGSGGVDPAVTVDGLSHGFGDVDVLDGVSLTVKAGSLVALVGPNGSGKSTLLRVVAGVLDPDGGRVDVAGSGVRPVGYLPQRPSFRPGFTVADTLGFYADLLGPEAASGVDVRAALEAVGLAEARNRRVEALSGGMTRLLGLAQALLGDPPVLVLDEPASGLDPAMSAHIYRTVREAADDGRAVFVASHDLAAIERTADRVALLDRGRIVRDGTPTELIDDAGVESLGEVFLDTVGATEGLTVRTGLGRAGEGERR
ncbi:ABC transporter ATP-binding protein [Salinigranum marinum]|uniref:ABC transporter ATP-binding protein n=1 Tax=Salinigranum marinum TaxID=1515595 RepID=UPI002989AE05|nr:ABC transporter ATP-binding protein [Salinigranum marinum]